MWMPATSSTFHSFVVKTVGSPQYCCDIGGGKSTELGVRKFLEVSVTGADTLDYSILASEKLVLHLLV